MIKFHIFIEVKQQERRDWENISFIFVSTKYISVR